MREDKDRRRHTHGTEKLGSSKTGIALQIFENSENRLHESGKAMAPHVVFVKARHEFLVKSVKFGIAVVKRDFLVSASHAEFKAYI